MDLGTSGLEILLATAVIFQTPLPIRQQSYGLVGLRNICPHTAAILLPGPCYNPSPKLPCNTSAPFHRDKPTGRPGSAPAPGNLEISHQKSAKKLPRRASKEQNHYVITINLNKNGL